MRHLRIRLGAWLLRPYLRRVIRHYAEAAADAERAGDLSRRDRCNYIALGLSYALIPEPNRWEDR